MIYSASRDCTINAWEPAAGKLVRTLKGHAHWVNTLALSTEHVLRTGPFDHTCVRPESDAAAKAAAKVRYDTARAGRPERLVSGCAFFCFFSPSLFWGIFRTLNASFTADDEVPEQNNGLPVN